ncbi:MAG: hypothetical protein ABSA84_03780 [Gammaproteobacteria bacterium]|jgi:hypothetical protein
MDILGIGYEKDFAEFTTIGLNCYKESLVANHDLSLPHDYCHPHKELLNQLKNHVVYKFLINDPHFQKALQKFKESLFFLKFHDVYVTTLDAIELEEEMSICLMRIFSLCVHPFLLEKTINVEILKRIANKAKPVKVLRKTETNIESIRNLFPSFPFINSLLTEKIIKLRQATHYLLSKTPYFYAKKMSGYFREQMLVKRICYLYFNAFNELCYPAISNLSIIVLNRSPTKITKDLIKKWIKKASREIKAARNLQTF